MKKIKLIYSNIEFGKKMGMGIVLLFASLFTYSNLEANGIIPDAYIIGGIIAAMFIFHSVCSCIFVKDDKETKDRQKRSGKR